MIIRDAIATDAAALGRVHGDAWQSAYEGLFDASFLMRAVEQRRHSWDRRLAEPSIGETTLLVALIGADVAAFWHGGPCEADPGRQEVFAVYAHPDQWGSGVAVALMQAGLKRLARTGDAEAVLWTLQGAARARRFYEKTGWLLTGDRRGHDFGDGRRTPLVQYRHPLT